MTPRDRYDVIILGAGPAGLAAAINIRRYSNRSVAVIDARSANREKIGESCPPDLILLLEQLGLTARFHRDQHAPCPGFASHWGSDRVGYNDFVVSPLGSGWRLNRRAFDGMLAESALEVDSDIIWNHRLIGVNQDDIGFSLAFVSRGKHLRVAADFVVDATGTQARFCSALGVDKAMDDQLFAIGSFSSVDAGSFTRQVLLEAVPEGWWYGASLPDARILTMLVTDRSTMRRMHQDLPSCLVQALKTTSLVGPALNRLSPHQVDCHIWPISPGLLASVAGDGWMAIGDAASSFDPIVAQGLCKALADGILAARLLVDGDPTGNQAQYSEMVRKRHETYRRHRAQLYAAEQRWPDRPFWQARSERPA